MGNASHKLGGVPDEHTGLTPNQVNLVQQTWSTYCSSHHEYGKKLFLSMFAKHPDYLALFPNFCDKPQTALKDDPLFRAHTCAIGYHLTSMVDSLNEPATFEILARQNAAEHVNRKGVQPVHFEAMGDCVVDVLRVSDKRHMTPDAVEAWRKFFAGPKKSFMLRVLAVANYTLSFAPT
ncbi:globin-like [Haemaphysalis longicornis]